MVRDSSPKCQGKAISNILEEETVLGWSMTSNGKYEYIFKLTPALLGIYTLYGEKRDQGCVCKCV